ncbi:MAG TPA: GGDEF domain-containing response regulator [Gammaproteobacteria bacterium]|nr:GGDEF domain-containing response regulator [Gammaproteobacteria bacterium]
MEQITAERQLRVLHIEDDLLDMRYINTVLKRNPVYRIDYTHVPTIKEALDVLGKQECDLVFLDLSLPDGYGLSLVKIVNSVVPDKPVIILSGNEDTELMLKAIEYGAQEYLAKDQLNSSAVLRAIRYAIDRKRMEARLTHLSNHDALTGLANRTLCKDRLEHALARARRQNTAVALLFVDLDHFKSINDTFGHEMGDAVLKQAAVRLQNCVREDDTVARLGGDEFIVILESLQSDEVVSYIAEKIIEELSKVFVVGEYEMHVTASVGISVQQGQGLQNVDAAQLMKYSDIAMYQVKAEGRNDFKYFTDAMRNASKRRIFLEKGLKDALQNQEFVLAYQPQIDQGGNSLIGGEALLRWQHPQLDLLMPNSFLPILLESNQIFAVNEWILHTACMQWRRWLDAGLVPPGSSVSVNLDARQFGQKNLIEWVERALAESGLKGEQLDLEITENLLMKNTDKNIQILNDLKKLGVTLSLDDFGTGFSSLGYLKYLPVDRLKIDRIFIKNLLADASDRAIVASMITLADKLEIEVLAEGVDSREQIDWLIQHGCHLFQGFYYAKPLFPPEFAKHGFL